MKTFNNTDPRYSPRKQWRDGLQEFEGHACTDMDESKLYKLQQFQDQDQKYKVD